MSFTNQTTNYGLPQWIGTDKPTYLVDQNGAYATIDAELYTANSNAATALSSAASAVEVAGTASTNAQTAIDSAATANTNANSAIATANTAITNAATAQSIAESAANSVDSLFATIDTHTYSGATTWGTIFDTAGTAVANSITDYPLSNYEYTIEIILSDMVEYFTFSRESSNVLTGSCTVNDTMVIIAQMYTAGSGSAAIQRLFSSSGVTQTDISTNSIASPTVVVSVSKRR